MSKTASKPNKDEPSILSKTITNPIALSVSEAAKLGGVQTKTIRRAISSSLIDYKVINNRYIIDLKSLITFLHSRTKLINKFKSNGLGQYIEKLSK